MSNIFQEQPSTALPEVVQTDTIPVAKPRRNRKSAKKAGTDLETIVARFLAHWFDDDRIERRAKSGRNDRGDVAGVRTIRGGRVVLECKSYSSDRIEIRKWLDETETERLNDDAAIGALVVKVRGKGQPEDQLVCMTLETFARLLEGGPDVAEF